MVCVHKEIIQSPINFREKLIVNNAVLAIVKYWLLIFDVRNILQCMHSKVPLGRWWLAQYSGNHPFFCHKCVLKNAGGCIIQGSFM